MSSDGKPITGPGSLFASLFPSEARTKAEGDYARALAEAQTAHPEPGKSESEEKNEMEPTKCWIN